MKDRRLKNRHLSEDAWNLVAFGLFLVLINTI
jgi:hypothetical protein